MPRRAAASACEVTLLIIGAAWLRTSSTFWERRSSAWSAARWVERIAPCAVSAALSAMSWLCWAMGLLVLVPIVSIDVPLLVGGGFRFSCPQAGRDDSEQCAVDVEFER